MFVRGAPAQFSNADRRPLLLSDWASILKSSHTAPVFVLNVVTSTLREQLAMLHAAAARGMPIRYVELGNELWDPRYAFLYPTGATYARAMNPWILAIKRAYPAAQVALSGVDNASFLISLLPGLKNWNASMLSVAKHEDAIAIHPYWDLPQPAGTSAAANATVATGLAEWQRFVARTLPLVPKHEGVWLTEWNQTDLLHKGGGQSWVQALTEAAFAIDTVTNKRIRVSLVHDVVDAARNPSANQPNTSLFPMLARSGGRILGLTANGYALGLVFGSLSSGDSVQQLKFRRGPSVSGFAGLQGVRIAARGRASSFDVINLTGNPRRVALPTTAAGRLAGVVRSARPTADPGFVATDTITRRRITTTTSGVINLPPYSIASLRPHR